MFIGGFVIILLAGIIVPIVIVKTNILGTNSNASGGGNVNVNGTETESPTVSNPSETTSPTATPTVSPTVTQPPTIAAPTPVGWVPTPVGADPHYVGSTWAPTIQQMTCYLVSFTEEEYASATNICPPGTLYPYQNDVTCYLKHTFSRAFPNGVTIGHAAKYQQTFTTWQSVRDYLPSTGGKLKLTGNEVDPSGKGDSDFGGELLAFTLNTYFDHFNKIKPPWPQVCYRDWDDLCFTELAPPMCVGISAKRTWKIADFIWGNNYAGCMTKYGWLHNGTLCQNPEVVSECLRLANMNNAGQYRGQPYGAGYLKLCD